MNQIRKLIQVKNQPAQERKKKARQGTGTTAKAERGGTGREGAHSGMGRKSECLKSSLSLNAWGRGNDRVSVPIKFCLYELRVVSSTRDMKETISDPQIYSSRNLC